MRFSLPFLESSFGCCVLLEASFERLLGGGASPFQFFFRGGGVSSLKLPFRGATSLKLFLREWYILPFSQKSELHSLQASLTDAVKLFFRRVHPL